MCVMQGYLVCMLLAFICWCPQPSPAVVESMTSLERKSDIEIANDDRVISTVFTRVSSLGCHDDGPSRVLVSLVVIPTYHHSNLVFRTALHVRRCMIFSHSPSRLPVAVITVTGRCWRGPFCALNLVWIVCDERLHVCARVDCRYRSPKQTWPHPCP